MTAPDAAGAQTPALSEPPAASATSIVRGRVGRSLEASLARHLPPSETALALDLVRAEIDPAALGADAVFALHYEPASTPVPAVRALRRSEPASNALDQGAAQFSPQTTRAKEQARRPAPGRRLLGLRIEDGGAVYEFKNLKRPGSSERHFVDRLGNPVRPADGETN